MPSSKARVAGELKEVVAREGDTWSKLATYSPASTLPNTNAAGNKQSEQLPSAAKSQMEIAQRALGQQQSFGGPRLHLESRHGQLCGGLIKVLEASHKAAMAGADVARKALDDATLARALCRHRVRPRCPSRRACGH